MCGIAGIISSKKNNLFYSNKLKKMISDINFRGPDDQGVWFDNMCNVYLAHARLAIIDLSKNAKQPMISRDGRFIISFNGEIYNHEDLREEMNTKYNIKWNSFSDTETLLKLIEIFGVKETLSKVKGMFAFSCYDRKSDLLYLSRDKFGEKPLYYGLINGDFYFSSDLKSLIVNNKNLELDLQSIDNFLMYSYIPSPKSILKNIYKLQSGCYLELNVQEFIKHNKNFYNISRWFDISFEAQNSKINQINDFNSCRNLVEEKVFTSVEKQLIADVPVGCFLSGGTDSTLIAIALKNVSKKKVETFSIGFENEDYDESKKSLKISKMLGLENNIFMMNENDLINMVDQLPEIYSEPFGDSSSLPSILLSKFSKKKVKVCLSGDGGDELFGGYNRYMLAEKIWKNLKFIPPFLRRYSKNFLINLSDKKKYAISNLFLKNFSEKNQKLEKFFDILDSETQLDLYKNILTKSKNSFNLVNYENKEDIILNNFNNFSSFKENMMLNDLNFYMQDDILCKVDRSSMFYGLETRVPFLDYEVFSTSWQVPLKFKENKLLLREIINSHINFAKIDGPKKGFSVPLKKWLNFDMKSKVEKYINEDNLIKYSFLNKDKITNIWSQFKNNKSINEHLIWNIFVLIQWLEKYKNNLKI